AREHFLVTSISAVPSIGQHHSRLFGGVGEPHDLDPVLQRSAVQATADTAADDCQSDHEKTPSVRNAFFGLLGGAGPLGAGSSFADRDAAGARDARETDRMQGRELVV